MICGEIKASSVFRVPNNVNTTRGTWGRDIITDLRSHDGSDSLIRLEGSGSLGAPVVLFFSKFISVEKIILEQMKVYLFDYFYNY